MKHTITLLIPLLLTGCVYYQGPNAVQVLEANEARVADCKLLGQVYGKSQYSFLAMGLEIAKDEAKKQAAEIGATHVFWTKIDPGKTPYVVGKAYHCPKLS